jgi:serpin B
MVRALSLSEMTLDQVNAASAALMNELLSADEEVELAIANSLWARLGVQFLPDFIRANRSHYDAEVTALDFASSQAAPWINTWVSNKTQGKIADIVDDPIDPMTIMFLLNAIYFKASWTEPFDPECTREADFHLLTGETKQVQRMHLFHDFRYLETESFQAVSLPYASERMSMYVFLPAETVGLPAFQAQLTRENWERWMAEFSYREGLVALPRFKVEYGAKLNSALTALGMGIAFDQNLADFSLMAETEFPIYISQVKHKTFIDLDEYGTEAAAVTMVEMALGAAPMEDEPEPFEMIVDRPFIIAIRDNTTGALLFLGSIVEP